MRDVVAPAAAGLGRPLASLLTRLRVKDVAPVCAVLGVDGVGLGSDFDGATIPVEIGDVRGLPRLVDAMRRHGYDEATLRKLCCDNWVSVLERTWGG